MKVRKEMLEGRKEGEKKELEKKCWRERGDGGKGEVRKGNRKEGREGKRKKVTEEMEREKYGKRVRKNV